MIWLGCAHCGRGYERTLKEHQRARRRRADPSSPQTTYCSQACARGGLEIGAKTTCPSCGGAKAPHAKTCSDCYAAEQATHMVHLECYQCGTAFSRQQAEWEKSKARHGPQAKAFCGQGCYQAFRHANPYVSKAPKGECLNCEAPIFQRKRQKFCCHKCYTDHRKKQADPDYTAYRGEWLQRRTEVLHRDHICRQCAKFGALEVHHIDHDATNNELTNLIGLCRTCHSSYHASPTSVQATWKQVYTALAST